MSSKNTENAPSTPKSPEKGEKGKEIGGMPANDLGWLVDLLNYSVGGAIQIDIKAVAEKRNLFNPRSVSNKIAELRKKYNLPLGNAKVEKDADAEVLTPPKARVSKTGAVKKTPVKRTPAKKAVIEKEEVNNGGTSDTRGDKDDVEDHMVEDTIIDDALTEDTAFDDAVSEKVNEA